MIPTELEARILRLATVEKWPMGTIAKSVMVHHSVVERVLEQQGLTELCRPSRPSIIDPFRTFIDEQFQKYPRLCASRLHSMVKQRGYPGGPDHFRHLVAPLRPRPAAEAFLRLRTLPGEQGQVDWGHFGTVKIGLAERPLMAFVMVLAYSRKLFCHFFLDAKMPSFLCGHQAAFRAFGGTPKVILYDNLKSCVLERRGDAIRFHPSLLAFAKHYCYEPRPVAVARGNEKARVERAIGTLRTSFFAARTWRDIEDLNAQAESFCEGASAHRRWPEDSRLTVRDAFEREKPMLLTLPENPFETDEQLAVSVGKTPYVRFDGNDYSVPHTAVRKMLLVKASLKVVRIIDGNQVIATHARSYDRKQQFEDPQHIQDLVEQKRKARRHRGLDRLSHAAPCTETLLGQIAERGGNLGAATVRLLRLLDQYGAGELEFAIQEALERTSPHLAAVKQVLERRRFAQGKYPPIALSLPENPRLKPFVVKPHPLKSYDTLTQLTTETKPSHDSTQALKPDETQERTDDTSDDDTASR